MPWTTSNQPWTSGDSPPLFVEGYSNLLSYKPGDELQLHVSTSVECFDVEIARIGSKRQVVGSLSQVAGTMHPVPEEAAAFGCSWPAACSVTVGTGWVSGYYEATLSVTDQGGKFTHRGARTASSVVGFVVRAAKPGKHSKILLQLTTNSWNAYNNWGGFSLYMYQGVAANQGHRASFDRPMGCGLFFNWEHDFVCFCERSGYQLEYAVNSDLEPEAGGPKLLENYSLVLSVGHDEYWSGGMRDTLEAFTAAGGNAAFFSGNTCCWQVRPEDRVESGAMESGETRTEARALTCWKQWYNYDPVYLENKRGGGSKKGSEELGSLSTFWSHALVQRPENQMTGVGFQWGGYHNSHAHAGVPDAANQNGSATGAYTVHRPEHWAFAHTGLANGATFGAAHTVVGYECDGCEFELDENGLPVPTHSDGTPETFTILAVGGPAIWAPTDAWWYEHWDNERVGACTLGVHTTAGGGTVFTAASTDWAHGLVGPAREVPPWDADGRLHGRTVSAHAHGELGDARVSQITHNVLRKLGLGLEPEPRPLLPTVELAAPKL